MEKDYIDIHDYEKMYRKAVEYLKKSDLSQKNKELILKFDETLSLIDQVGLARRIRVISYLINIAKEHLKKNFDKATREDIKQTIKQIDEKNNYSVWTKQGYRVIIKKFYRWLAYGDDYNSPEHKLDYPKIVSWISCNIRSDRLPKITVENILTENEIAKILEATSNDIQNEAIVAVLYESGCRIGEHGGVRLKHIKKEGDCYTITVKGKTGIRETFIVKLANILTNWLNAHPDRENPDAPLWLKQGSSTEPMMYTSFTQLIKRLAKKAGIKKRIYPHIFRHSRATHAIVQGEFTSDGAKKIFGWCPDSKMLETYLHLTSADVKDRYLEKLGLNKSNKESMLNPRICPHCKYPNLFNASICEKCQTLLDNDLGIALDERMVAMRKFLLMLSQDKYVRFRIEEMANENKDFLGVMESIAHEEKPAQS